MGKKTSLYYKIGTPNKHILNDLRFKKIVVMNLYESIFILITNKT